MQLTLCCPSVFRGMWFTNGTWIHSILIGMEWDIQ